MEENLHSTTTFTYFLWQIFLNIHPIRNVSQVNSLNQESCYVETIQKHQVLKILIGGEGGIGKTTLMNACKGTFTEGTRMTVGVDIHEKTVHLSDKKVKLAIWDLGGQERFHFILPSFMKGAHGGIVCFSLERYKSFLEAEKWILMMRSINPSIPLILVGTKADIECTGNDVDLGEIEQLVQNHELLGYIRTSSKSGEGVEGLIETIIGCFLDP
ncbi:MAG: Rab family GTPase [Candidatus Hodarchaeota archaeon]